MRFGDDDLPGHKVRRNKNGTVRHGWAARHDLVKLGYRPKWVRLHYNFEDRDERLLAAAQCRKLQAEMLAWASGIRSHERAFDGTVAGLVRAARAETDQARTPTRAGLRRQGNGTQPPIAGVRHGIAIRNDAAPARRHRRMGANP